MIVHIENIESANLDNFGALIVGAGFAGLELALRLAAKSVRSLVIESGREAVDESFQQLLLLDVVGRPRAGRHNFNSHLENRLAETGRIRAFGGTSAIWSGRWKRLDADDFAAKSWVPFSGWPIGEAELLPYFRSVEQDFGLSSFDDFQTRLPEAALAKSGLRAGFHFDQRHRPTRLAETHAERIRRHADILVVLGATATEVRLTEDCRTASGVIVRSISARIEKTFRGRTVVLACGGLETPRLMLASSRQISVGLGNQNDLVGRFYMDHPKIRAGRFNLNRRDHIASKVRLGRRRDPFVVGIALSLAERAAMRLPNHTIYLTSRVRPATTERSWTRVSRRIGRLLGAADEFATTFYLEQTPDPASRVRLSDRRDAVGVLGLSLDWRLNRADQESVAVFARRLSEDVRNSGLGTFDFSEGELDLDQASGANHPMGTTRMAGGPDLGVVDADCRVFGTSNLFVAGSSVFSTGGNANPTYTVVCLARRLADRIARSTL